MTMLQHVFTCQWWVSSMTVKSATYQWKLFTPRNWGVSSVAVISATHQWWLFTRICWRCQCRGSDVISWCLSEYFFRILTNYGLSKIISRTSLFSCFFIVQAILLHPDAVFLSLFWPERPTLPSAFLVKILKLLKYHFR